MGYLLGRKFLILNLDTVTLSYDFECLGVGYILALHDEVDGIATLATAETLVYTARRRDHKRGCLLLMERTARLIVYALAFERNVVANNIYDIGSSKYSVYGFAVNHSRKDNYFFDNSPPICRKK